MNEMNLEESEIHQPLTYQGFVQGTGVSASIGHMPDYNMYMNLQAPSNNTHMLNNHPFVIGGTAQHRHENEHNQTMLDRTGGNLGPDVLGSLDPRSHYYNTQLPQSMSQMWAPEINEFNRPTQAYGTFRASTASTQPASYPGASSMRSRQPLPTVPMYGLSENSAIPARTSGFIYNAVPPNSPVLAAAVWDGLQPLVIVPGMIESTASVQNNPFTVDMLEETIRIAWQDEQRGDLGSGKMNISAVWPWDGEDFIQRHMEGRDTTMRRRTLVTNTNILSVLRLVAKSGPTCYLEFSQPASTQHTSNAGSFSENSENRAAEQSPGSLLANTVGKNAPERRRRGTDAEGKSRSCQKAERASKGK